jgi:hemoglobin-like flavoprotein
MKTQNRLLVKNCLEQLNNETETLSRLFYKALFQYDLQLKTVFSGSVVFLNRKFSSMLTTLKNVKHLEKIENSIAKMGARHVLQYGAEIKHFPVMKQALLKALSEHLGAAFDAPLEAAFHEVYDDVSRIMEKAMAELELEVKKNPPQRCEEINLWDEIGGEAQVLNVHKRFYDIMFDEPWLEDFFLGKSKEALIKKQTQFMVAAFNGPNDYQGDTPAFVHMHMFITDEMIALRERILKASILAEGLSETVAEKWLAVDHSFKAAIVKKSPSECVLKCKGQFPIVVNKPEGYKAKF